MRAAGMAADGGRAAEPPVGEHPMDKELFHTMKVRGRSALGPEGMPAGAAD